jgi:RNA polymerase sigma factor (sigma-70 family)
MPHNNPSQKPGGKVGGGYNMAAKRESIAPKQLMPLLPAANTRQFRLGGKMPPILPGQFAQKPPLDEKPTQYRSGKKRNVYCLLDAHITNPQRNAFSAGLLVEHYNRRQLEEGTCKKTLVEKILSKYRLLRGIQKEDHEEVEQIVFSSLLISAMRWNARDGTPFEAYAIKCARACRYSVNQLNVTISVPRNTDSFARKFMARCIDTPGYTIRQFVEEGKIAPNDSERVLNALEAIVINSHMMSLHTAGEAHEEDAGHSRRASPVRDERSSALLDDSQNPERKVGEYMVSERLEALMREILTPYESNLLSMRYGLWGEGISGGSKPTLQRLANHFGCSITKIKRNLKKAKRKLAKSAKHSAEFREMLEAIRHDSPETLGD